MSDRHEGTKEQVRRRGGRRCAGWRSQRGAVLAEAAIVLPVILTLLLGILEFGFIWKDDLAITNAVRAGVRIGAAEGNTANGANPDYDMLVAVKTALNSAIPNGQIQFISVFNATNGSSSLPGGCDTGSVTNVCNYYAASVVNNPLVAADYGGNAGDRDLAWNPQNRKVCIASGTTGPPDYVGVYVKINHQYVTKMFGASRTLSDSVVMRLEPQC